MIVSNGIHTKLLTEFETLGVMGENNSGIIHFLSVKSHSYIARLFLKIWTTSTTPSCSGPLPPQKIKDHSVSNGKIRLNDD